MFFSHLLCNNLLTGLAYQRKRVVLRLSTLQRRKIGCISAFGRVRGFSCVSVLFGVPGFKWAGVVSVCVTVFMLMAAPSSAEERTISMYNIHTEETIAVTFKRDGKYIPEGLQKLNHFMRDWRRSMEIKMDPALIDLIWELHEELGSKQPVHLICGYRSAGTNELLRQTVGGQARNSRHITGQAADLTFPDVPLKQLRYSALVRERGGVGYYPASGLPFVHVDTGNVRHWPRMPRIELAVLFPRGRSLHVPSDGRPLTPTDARIALAKWQSSGNEMPWVLSHKRVSGPMLASLVPEQAPLLQRASLSGRDAVSKTPSPAPQTVAKPGSLTQEPAEQPEPQLAEEGEEQEDDIAFEPLPATFLLAEKPLSYFDMPGDQPRQPVFQKIGLLMASPSALASEEFDHRLQIEGLYEANTFKGPAIAFIQRQKARMAAATSAKSGDAITPPFEPSRATAGSRGLEASRSGPLSRGREFVVKLSGFPKGRTIKQQLEPGIDSIKRG